MYITTEARYFATFINYLDCIEKPDKIIHIGLDIPPGFQGIVYNTEQLTIPRILKKILKIANIDIWSTVIPSTLRAPVPWEPLVKKEVWEPLVPIEFWDYSLANINILEKYGITAKHMPLKTTGPYLEKLKRFAECTKIYDIGFNGSMSPRRKVILDKLATSFTVLTSTSWGDKRDMELAQCRVLVNIHFDTDYMIFESARCEPWLAIGVPVISELSIDNDDRCILTSYDGFFDTVTSYFHNNYKCLN